MRTPATSTQDHASPAQFLRAAFLERKNRNAVYSLRAFARDLGISQALLSLVINEKRPLTVKQALQIAVMLELSPRQSEDFLKLTLLAHPKKSKATSKLALGSTRPKVTAVQRRNYDAERFKLISLWHHVAILDLTTTANFNPDPGWIARRLGISSLEARDAIQRLILLGLLERRGDTLKKSEEHIAFVTQKSEPAVRAFHKKMIALAAQQLDRSSDGDFARRDISGMTMAIRSERLPEAKKRIKEFQKELADFLSEGACDEVYQLNMQLFPLTHGEV